MRIIVRAIIVILFSVSQFMVAISAQAQTFQSSVLKPIAEIEKIVKGIVKVKETSSSGPYSVKQGDKLRCGDELQVGKGSEVIIRFLDNRPNIHFGEGLHLVQQCRLMPFPYTAKMLYSARTGPPSPLIPRLLYPRGGYVIAVRPAPHQNKTGRLTIYWEKAPGATYYNVILTSSDDNWTWRPSPVEEVKIEFPDDPRYKLRPGGKYLVSVSAGRHSSDYENDGARFSFRLITDQAAKEVFTAINRIEQFELPEEKKTLLKAQEYASARLYHTAIELLIKARSSRNSADMLFFLGELYLAIEMSDKAEEMLIEARGKLSKNDASLEMGLVLYRLGVARWNLGKEDEGKTLLKEALTIFQKLNNHEWSVAVCKNLDELK